MSETRRDEARRLRVDPGLSISELMKHAPSTKRANTGADYHGCLVVNVPQSRGLYWRVEGLMAALTG